MRWNLPSNPRLAWHDWFAWHPITLRNGERIWLETIRRKQKYDGTDSRFERIFERVFFLIDYEYRDPMGDENERD